MDNQNVVMVSAKVSENYRVTQSNSLIESSYKLSLEEKRLIMAAIATIDPRREVPHEITIIASDYAETYGLKIDAAYTQLQEATDRLYERDIKFKINNGEGRQRWVDRAIYHKKKGAVTISFSQHLHPHLSQLTGEHTSYILKNVKSVKSIYSFRLFELLSQYRSVGKRFFTISDLRANLGVEDRYKKFSELRRNVIEAAIEELNTKSNLHVTYYPEKKGTVIQKLWFEFTEKKQMSLLDDAR